MSHVSSRGAVVGRRGPVPAEATNATVSGYSTARSSWSGTSPPNTPLVNTVIAHTRDASNTAGGPSQWTWEIFARQALRP